VQVDLAVAERPGLGDVHAAQVLEAAVAREFAGHAERVGQRDAGAGLHQRDGAELVAQRHRLVPAFGEQQRRRLRQGFVDEGAGPARAADQAFAFQQAEGLPHGRARDAIALDQDCQRRHLLAGPPAAAVDVAAEYRRHLQVQRLGAAREQSAGCHDQAPASSASAMSRSRCFWILTELALSTDGKASSTWKPTGTLKPASARRQAARQPSGSGRAPACSSAKATGPLLPGWVAPTTGQARTPGRVSTSRSISAGLTRKPASRSESPMRASNTNWRPLSV